MRASAFGIHCWKLDRFLRHLRLLSRQITQPFGTSFRDTGTTYLSDVRIERASPFASSQPGQGQGPLTGDIDCLSSTVSGHAIGVPARFT
jgi:hypothetical protein